MTLKDSPMLKISVVIVLLMSIGPLVNAQLLIGPKVGVLGSRIVLEDDTDKDLYDIKPVLGFSAGGSISMKVRDRFFLQTDFLYSRKGKRLTWAEDALLEMETVNHYIEVPIIYRVDFRAHLGRDFKYFFGVGPNVSYWLKSSGTLKATELLETDIEELEYTANFDYDAALPNPDQVYIDDPNRLQLGLNIAGGVILEPHGTSEVIIDIRLELGHSYLAKSQGGEFKNVVEFQDPMKARVQSLQLAVAWMWDTNIAQRKRGKSNINRKKSVKKVGKKKRS